MENAEAVAARCAAAAAEVAAWPDPEPIRPPFFVRVRKRKLKGADGEWRVYALGPVPTPAMSFDLVRSVRVNGAPRHKVLLGLGSQKDYERCLVSFWYNAIIAMERHGLDAEQRRRVADEMICKGARRPLAEHCETVALLNRIPGYPPFKSEQYKPEIAALAEA